MESLTYIDNLHSSRESKRERYKDKQMCRTKLGCYFFRHIFHSKFAKSCRFTLGLSLVLVNYSEVCHSSRSTEGEGKWLPLELASVSLEVLLSLLKHEGLRSKE